MERKSSFKEVILYLTVLFVVIFGLVTYVPPFFYTNESTITSGFELKYTLLVGVGCSLLGASFGKVLSWIDDHDSGVIISGAIIFSIVFGAVIIAAPLILVEVGFEIKFDAGAGLRYNEILGVSLLTSIIMSIAYNIPTSDED